MQSATIHAAPAQLALIRTAANDLRAVGKITELSFVEAPDAAASEVSVTDVVLAQATPPTTATPRES